LFCTNCPGQKTTHIKHGNFDRSLFAAVFQQVSDTRSGQSLHNSCAWPTPKRSRKQFVEQQQMNKHPRLVRSLVVSCRRVHVRTGTRKRVVRTQACTSARACVCLGGRVAGCVKIAPAKTCNQRQEFRPRFQIDNSQTKRQ
jgi:hypothetical protein